MQTRISHTSHKSRVTASILALLVAQAIRWHYSASVWSSRFVVAFEMVWGGVATPVTPPPPRSAHAPKPSDDSVFAYAVEVMSFGLFYLSFKDAIKEGNSIKVIRSWKYFIPIFEPRVARTIQSKPC